MDSVRVHLGKVFNSQTLVGFLQLSNFRRSLLIVSFVFDMSELKVLISLECIVEDSCSLAFASVCSIATTAYMLALETEADRESLAILTR